MSLKEALQEAYKEPIPVEINQYRVEIFNTILYDFKNIMSNLGIVVKPKIQVKPGSLDVQIYAVTEEVDIYKNALSQFADILYECRSFGAMPIKNGSKILVSIVVKDVLQPK